MRCKFYFIPLWGITILLTAVSLRAQSWPYVATSQVPASFFAINDRSTQGHWPPKDTNGTLLPIAGTRFWDTSTCWAQLETASGVYTWTTLNTLVTNAQSNNMDMELTFGGTPGWAITGATHGAPCGSGGGFTDAPNDINLDGSGTDAQWKTFVQNVVTNYKGKIKYYSPWNEENSKATYWYGTAAQAARMAYDLYQTVHCGGTGGTQNIFGGTCDSNALVLTPSMTGGSTAESSCAAPPNAGFCTYFGVTLPTSVVGSGNSTNPGSYADIIVFHGRESQNAVPPGFPDNKVPESVLTILNGAPAFNTGIKQVFANQASVLSGKPIWMDEGGWRPNEVTDVNTQAAYVARYMLLLASQGIARAAWYGWDSASTGVVDNCFGPLYATTANQTVCFSGVNSTTVPTIPGPTIAATAYTQVKKWLSGGTIAPCANTSGTQWTCNIIESGGTSALAVWDTSSGGSTYPGSGFNDYLDLTGASTSPVPATVSIGNKPILLEVSPSSSWTLTVKCTPGASCAPNSVASSPSGINCPSGACTFTFANNTSITLTETFGSGYTFSNWSGGCSGTNTTCSITLTAATTVNASFTAVTPVLLTLMVNGGTVTSSPSGINCPSTCSIDFLAGTNVTLTESASAGFTFTSWMGGGCSGSASTCTVTLNNNTTVQAVFLNTQERTSTVNGTSKWTGKSKVN